MIFIIDLRIRKVSNHFKDFILILLIYSPNIIDGSMNLRDYIGFENLSDEIFPLYFPGVQAGPPYIYFRLSINQYIKRVHNYKFNEFISLLIN